MTRVLVDGVFPLVLMVAPPQMENNVPFFGSLSELEFWYHYVPISESGSRQWPLLPILLPDIIFLGHRGINKLFLCKMHIRFLSQRFRFCLRVS